MRRALNKLNEETMIEKLKDFLKALLLYSLLDTIILVFAFIMLHILLGFLINAFDFVVFRDVSFQWRWDLIISWSGVLNSLKLGISTGILSGLFMSMFNVFLFNRKIKGTVFTVVPQTTRSQR
jgi:ABC-type Fe3+ transport system permease subunit